MIESKILRSLLLSAVLLTCGAAWAEKRVDVEATTGVATLYSVVSVIAKADESDIQTIREFLESTEGPMSSVLVGDSETNAESEFLGEAAHPANTIYINKYIVARAAKDKSKVLTAVVTEKMLWDSEKKKYTSQYEPVFVVDEDVAWTVEKIRENVERTATVDVNAQATNDFLLALASNPQKVAELLKGKDLSDHGVVQGRIVYDEDDQPKTYVLNGLANLGKSSAESNIEALQTAHDAAREGSIVIQQSGSKSEGVNFNVSIEAGAFSEAE